MKTYTRNDIQRMATEKAIEILTTNKDMMFTNVSYGLSKCECLVGLANGHNSFNISKEIYIVLEQKGTWSDNIYDLAVYEEIKGEDKLVEVIGTFYGIRDKQGRDIFVIDKEAYEKHKERQYKKYSSKDMHWNIKMGTELNLKLKERIQRDTGKKIKKQDIVVRKYNKGYVISYDYRNVRKNLYLK